MMIPLETEVIKKGIKKKGVPKLAPAPKPQKIIVPREYEFLLTKTFDSATETAIYYGFMPISNPVTDRNDSDRARELRNSETGDDLEIYDFPLLSHRLEEKITMLRAYSEKNWIIEPQPVMFAYKECENKNRKKHISRDGRLTLDLIGPSRSGSEAVLIKTAISILEKHGIKDVMVEINALGDRQAAQRFAKELIPYYRKYLNDMPAPCIQLMKKDPFLLGSCEHEKCRCFAEGAPKPTHFLSEPAREHLKEVFEYLETLGIPYRINDLLVGSGSLYPQTIFRIVSPDTGTIHATGVRFDWLGKKAGCKKETPIVSLKMVYKKDTQEKQVKIKPPRLCFVTLGTEAKLKSLEVIETLRQAKVLVYQALGRDKFAGQVALADKLRLPYVLIMGKKEAMENSVIVRNTITRSQEVVLIPNLAQYVKAL
ncbi:MAG: His/Gly/Thr/Pro-type tRNA ligase C-terminal domain-containing protein [Candidatus Paceibacterota bacterium]|jgi:histidyl-tRNA synthetase